MVSYRERVTLPSIRSLFPEMWSRTPTGSPRPGSTIQSWLQPSRAGVAASGHYDAPSRVPPTLDALNPPSTLQRLPSVSAPEVIQLHPRADVAASREDPYSAYSLGIMRLHPLTADLEHVASSSNVSSPPRAPYRSGLVPYAQKDTPANDVEGQFSGSNQPMFRVAISPTTLPDGHPDGDDDSSRRHRCPHCGKGFNRPSSLVTHINMHTGERPYACLFDGCPRRFNVKSNMRRHYQRQHLRPPRCPPPRSREGSTPSSAPPSPSPDQRAFSPAIAPASPLGSPSAAFEPQS